ncbi:MAG TPA: amidase [Acidimicrobiales bacterium]|nr:amidase [Acidimicrobiales bacterium]
MHEFITRMQSTGDGPRLGVKDLIDVAGVKTTAGSLAVASISSEAVNDAPLMRGAREANVRIVGKTNLYELAFGASGVNPHFGTPVNPLDAALLPGGSSSGSAVAVAIDEADIAYGSDSGGSIRVPSAFCGTAGLKTTHGRIPLEGVYPLSPSLDTVGPMARDVSGLVLGMELLEPGFSIGSRAESIGLVRSTGVVIDERIQTGIDKICHRSGIQCIEIDLGNWMAAYDAGSTVLYYEAVASNRTIIGDEKLYSMLSAPVRERLEVGAKLSEDDLKRALGFRSQWQAELDAIFQRVDILALPSVGFFAPPLEEAFEHVYTHLTMPFNLAGYPAVSIPIDNGYRLPASLQLLGPRSSEELLLASAQFFELINKN